jgi:hypothetical protein
VKRKADIDRLWRTESEQIWLAAVKLEAENGEFGIVRELLIRGCVLFIE